MNKAVYFTDIEPEVVTLKGVKKYYVAGMVSTTDPDLVNDVLTKEAQTQIYDSIQDRITKGGFITGDTEHLVFYDENGKQLPTPKVRDEKGNLIIPELKFVEAKLLDNGVWAKAEVNSHHERFNTIWKSIQDGFLNAFSVAVIPIRKVSRLVKGVMTDFISDIKLINITLTGSPCNPNATMTPVLKAYLNKLKTSENMDYNKLKEKVESTANKEQLKVFYSLCDIGFEYNLINYLDAKTITSKTIDDSFAFVFIDMSFTRVPNELKEYNTKHKIVDLFLQNELSGLTNEQKIEYFMTHSQGFSHEEALKYVKKNNTNSKKLEKGDKMDKKLKSIYDELSDEDKAKYDALESEEEKAEFLKGFEPEDKTEDEVQEPEVKDEPKDEPEKVDSEDAEAQPDLKSLEASLKTALKAIIEKETKELKVELKGLQARLDKLEKTPIKKSIVSDPSVMLGKSEMVDLNEKSIYDLMK